jgi:dTDP-glucose 4,6-dehydratase
MRVLVTGAAGFIGSHLVRHLLTERPDWQVVGLDALTYAGNLESLADLQRHPRFHFVKGDICDAEAVRGLFGSERIDGVFHLAAESHVDRSIAGPMAFVRTNVEGTATLLEAARAAWQGREGCRFLHVSTDEVFGSLGVTGRFDESTPYQPHSPYSASKAASDHMVRAWHDTYGFPSLVTNCTNNYGPYQFPEKLIPLVLLRAGRGEVVPVYGKGENVRDWLFVEDHCAALLRVFEAGELGGSYGIGGESECTNLALVQLLLDLHDEAAGEPVGRSRKLISFVTDRPGHDFRYAMDISKIRRELGWSPRVSLREGMAQTVAWYLANGAWTASVTTGAYRAFEQTWYATRAGGEETGEA